MNYNEENNNLVLKFKRFRKINKDKYIHDFVLNLNSSFSRYKIGRFKLRMRYLICMPFQYSDEMTLFLIRNGKFENMINGADMKLLFMAIMICGEEDLI